MDVRFGRRVSPTRVSLPRDALDRLAKYIESLDQFGVERTDHWHHYGRLSTIRADRARSEVELRAGAGFDSDFERNFRSTTIGDLASAAIQRVTGRFALAKYRKAFAAIWGNNYNLGIDAALTILGRPENAHKILAVHYVNRLLPHLAVARTLRYLEIGAGSGYLAALMFQLRAVGVTIVDLPEIVPFSFLYLTRRFPAATYALPNELSLARGGAPPDFVFLAPNQLANVPDASIDLAVNTASFGEMFLDQIREYFWFLRRVAAPGGLFYTVNRVEKWMRPAVTPLGNDVPGQEVAVRFADYPWSAQDRDIHFARSDFHDLVQRNPMMSRLCVLAHTARHEVQT